MANESVVGAMSMRTRPDGRSLRSQTPARSSSKLDSANTLVVSVGLALGERSHAALQGQPCQAVVVVLIIELGNAVDSLLPLIIVKSPPMYRLSSSSLTSNSSSANTVTARTLASAMATRPQPAARGVGQHKAVGIGAADR